VILVPARADGVVNIISSFARRERDSRPDIFVYSLHRLRYNGPRRVHLGHLFLLFCNLFCLLSPACRTVPGAGLMSRCMGYRFGYMRKWLNGRLCCRPLNQCSGPHSEVPEIRSTLFYGSTKLFLDYAFPPILVSTADMERQCTLTEGGTYEYLLGSMFPNISATCSILLTSASRHR
jgi:hypothetical protein